MNPTADVSVRPAVPEDAARVARIQLAAWRTLHAGTPAEAAMAAVEEDAVATTWRASIERPPDPRHQVLVACAGPDVVGFAAAVPSRPADPADPAEPGAVQIVALEVDPARRREGHASRLLAAVVDLARERGAHHVQAWSLETDEARMAFLTGAGLSPAGLRRTLDVPGAAMDEVLLTAAL
ncbi:GNAT family N-acetyltransferase [Beutenbergia cavernae]|uniref:GNAT family N-acetyltransferase n=1 Tax=Beutenbergia cavernae TaxID=84757 RepID=UPI00019ACF99|nr:GNAT family N-acetyltransferase [Beutenbergia cavernae]